MSRDLKDIWLIQVSYKSCTIYNNNKQMDAIEIKTTKNKQIKRLLQTKRTM